MKKKIAIGFISVLLLIFTIAFSGCIEEKLSIKAPETTVPPTTTPDQIPVEEEIEVLVKELGYDDEMAQYVAREANSWTDTQGNPVLQGWKGELRGTREQHEESKMSVDGLAEVEIKITKKLSQKIKEEIPDYNEDNWHLEKVIRDKEANCFGYTQILFVLGTAINLSVVPIDVRVEIGNIRGDHSACLINLSDARNMILVDLISSPALISEPFMLEKEYEKVDNYFGLINKDNIMILHPRFRICDEDVLIAGIINSRGITYADLGEHQKAISEFTKAMEIDPKYAHVHYNRGKVYHESKEYQKAISDYTKAIELDPEYVEAYYNRGNTYTYLSEYKKAIYDYTRAIEIDPKDAVAYSSRGITYADLGEYQKAISDYTKAIELNPEYAGAYSNRGFAYYESKEYQKAISDYTKAIELDPEYAGTYVRRGTAYLIIGEPQKAQRDFDMAIGLDPRLEGVVQKIFDCFIAEGGYE